MSKLKNNPLKPAVYESFIYQYVILSILNLDMYLVQLKKKLVNY